MPTGRTSPHRHQALRSGSAAAAPERVLFSLDVPQAAGSIPPGNTATQDDARTRIRTQWTARLATPADAELLHVPIGTIVLHIVRTVTDPDGAVIKSTSTLCPANRTVLHHSYPIPTTP